MKPRQLFWLCVFVLVTLLTACGGGGGGSSDDGGGPVTDDTTAPSVISTSPIYNDTAVATNHAITVTFDDTMDPVTITSDSFLVEDLTGAPITGSVTYDEASRTATFRTDDLSPETTYVATITADVEDVAGNGLSDDYTWQFTTGNPLAPDTVDTTPPTVLNRFPVPNASSVAPNTAVWVTFNEPIDPLTINAQTLTLNGTSQVTGTVTYVGSSALFQPSSNLLADTVYTVSVGGAIEDLAGNPLGTPVVWNFTTGSQVDVLGPQVLSVSPPDGAVNVPTISSIVVNFDEAIKPFQFGAIDGRPVAVTFNEGYTSVTMLPTAGLRPGVSYNSSIFVPDQAGNQMDEAFVWKFTTTP
jgi:hypothetical protein